MYYRFFRRNVKIAFPFKAFSKVIIIGPGVVKIGKNCSVHKNVFRGLTIVTYSNDSEVVIGERCALGGLTIRCNKRVEIGDHVMTANSLIQDSFFLNQDKQKYLSNKRLLRKIDAVIVGNNVWLTPGCILLGGTTVGNDCVIAAGSWCFNSKTDDYSIAIGNPVKMTIPIEKLQRLKGIL